MDFEAGVIEAISLVIKSMMGNASVDLAGFMLPTPFVDFFAARIFSCSATSLFFFSGWCLIMIKVSEWS